MGSVVSIAKSGDRSAFEHRHSFSRTRQANRILGRDHVELHEEIGKIDAPCGLIEDDAHRAVGRMRAQIDDRAGEPLVRHAGHRHQHLTVEEPVRAISTHAHVPCR